MFARPGSSVPAGLMADFISVPLVLSGIDCSESLLFV
jgi:hypothetical protein